MSYQSGRWRCCQLPAKTLYRVWATSIDFVATDICHCWSEVMLFGAMLNNKAARHCCICRAYFPVKNLYAFLIFSLRATYDVHITLAFSCRFESFSLRSSLLCFHWFCRQIPKVRVCVQDNSYELGGYCWTLAGDRVLLLSSYFSTVFRWY
jgi:hypothetical protein